MNSADQPDHVSDIPDVPTETSMPVQPAASDRASRPFRQDDPPRYEPGSALILIGEDHESSRVALRRMLESEGYAVEEAEDGAEVLRKYALCHPQPHPVGCAHAQAGWLSSLRETPNFAQGMHDAGDYGDGTRRPGINRPGL